LQFSRALTGVTVKDVDVVFSRTRHTTCISPSLGGSGNPSVITARGIVCAIQVQVSSRTLNTSPATSFSAAPFHMRLQAAAEWLGQTLRGKVVAVQGCGQVGLPLCRYLVAEGARVIVSESSPQRIAEVSSELQKLAVELRFAPFGDNSIL
jgi:leucine dehydrogenase